jgi:UDP-glucose 4-epimerase
LLRALVTGGAGFIGSHLVDRLTDCGHEVTVYDLTTGKNLFDPDGLISAVQGQDVVFHLAGLASVRMTDDPRVITRLNIDATQEVLEAMRATGVKRIAFSSTSAAYGDTALFPTPENCPWPVQTSLYAASKVAAEALLAAYARSFDMQATIFRFAPVLGERYRRGHLYDFWCKLKRNPGHIEVLGDGQQRRSFIYVGDVADAMLLAGLAETAEPVRIFNVGHYQSCTVNQSLTWLCESMGLHPERSYTGSSWAGDKRLTLLDCTKLQALGWTPKVSIKEAVFRTVKSFDG